MLRGLRPSGILLEALGLAGLYAILASLIEVSLLIQILNGIFVGVFVAIIPSYWRVAWEQIALADPYDREHQFVLGIGLLWTGAIMNRLVSIGTRIIQGELALVSDTQFTAGTIYILILAGVLQITAMSQSSLGTSRDRRFLLRSAIAGAGVAIILIVAQMAGTGFLAAAATLF